MPEGALPLRCADAPMAAEPASGVAQTRGGAFPPWLLELYHCHRRALARYLQRKYGSGPPEPDDIAQDAFAKLAAMGDDEHRAIDNPRAFLFRVAENLVISAKRRARIARSYATEVNYLERGSSELTPERVLTAKDQLDVVERAIRAMPERRRRCFIMHRYDELSLTEIAHRCGISANGVKGHVERALRDISEALADAKQIGRGED